MSPQTDLAGNTRHWMPLPILIAIGCKERTLSIIGNETIATMDMIALERHTGTAETALKLQWS